MVTVNLPSQSIILSLSLRCICRLSIHNADLIQLVIDLTDKYTIDRRRFGIPFDSSVVAETAGQSGQQ